MKLKDCTKEELIFVIERLQFYSLSGDYYVQRALGDVEEEREARKLREARRLSALRNQKMQEYIDLLAPYDGKRLVDIPDSVFNKASAAMREAEKADRKHGLKYHILDCMGEVDCWEQCGRFMLFPETAEEKRIFNRTNMDFSGKSEAFCREKDVDLQLMGMRKAESARRKAMLNKKGTIYAVKSRDSMTCCPLANLTSEDIWAYIFSNNLRYLPIIWMGDGTTTSS